MMTSIKATIITLLIVYLLIGNILWIIGVKAFGGTDTYRQYLKEHDENIPLWFIFLVFIFAWPLFLRKHSK